MAERSIPELSPAAREMLGALRADESPTAGQRRRQWAALQQRVGGPSASAASVAPAVTGARGLYYAKVVAVTMALAAAVLVAVKLVGMGVATLDERAREPAVEAPYRGGAESEGGQARSGGPSPGSVDRPERPAAAAPGEGQSEAVVGTEVVVQTPVESAVVRDVAEPESVRPRPRPSPRPASEPASAASSLMAELALIKEATAAKQQGRTAAGLRALQRHAEQFPKGTLADERRVLRAELLCAAGRPDEARAEVRSFLRQRAGSALSGRMERACPEGS
ncbi:MAG: hypothetical protein AB1Z98_14750 [Nannocystaceae bacterium]